MVGGDPLGRQPRQQLQHAEPFQVLEGPGDGVRVDQEVSRQLPHGREFFPCFKVSPRNSLPDLLHELQVDRLSTGGFDPKLHDVYQGREVN